MIDGMMTPAQCATYSAPTAAWDAWHALTIYERATNRMVAHLPRLDGEAYIEVMRQWPQTLFPKPQYRYEATLCRWYAGMAWEDWCERQAAKPAPAPDEPGPEYEPLDVVTLLNTSITNHQHMAASRRDQEARE